MKTEQRSKNGVVRRTTINGKRVVVLEESEFDIIRARRKLGLSQAALARLAGIRVETLNRIENAKNKPNVTTIEKIDQALRGAARKEAK